MSPHPLTNFEIQKYYQNEPRFNGVYCRDNLPKAIKDGAYVINLDEYADVGTHWIALYVKNIEIIHFDSFGIEHVPKGIKKFIGHKNIKTNIFRIQANNSIMCRYFCIGLIDFMLVGKTFIDYTSLFSPYFNSEIRERKTMSKRLNKYIAAFDYFDKTLTVLSAISGGIFIISFASVIGVPVGLASASFSLAFSLTTGIIKRLLKITRNKKKKHNKIVMQAVV